MFAECGQACHTCHNGAASFQCGHFCPQLDQSLQPVSATLGRLGGGSVIPVSASAAGFGTVGRGQTRSYVSSRQNSRIWS